MNASDASHGFLRDDELKSLGFAEIGSDVRLSRRASIHGASRIRIGSHVRIDDFAVLSAGAGGITIGSHVHIAVFVSMIGSAKITISDFAGLSSRVAVLSSSDDFGGSHLTGPTVPAQLTRVVSEPVSIGRHAVVGAGSVVLPGASMGDGSVVGAMSLVKGSLPPFTIYAGIPVRKIGDRSRDLLQLESSLRQMPGAD